MDKDIYRIRFNSYISCISEHQNSHENYGKLGKLSMWRAYAPRNGVAIVLNPQPFLGESDPFGLFSVPVQYSSDEKFLIDFGHWVENIVQLGDEPFQNAESSNYFTHILRFSLQTMVVSTKHPIFCEEEEWRIIGWQEHIRRDRIIEAVETVNGIPQLVYKVPLKNYPVEDFFGTDVREFIQKIIVGPSDFPYEIATALIREMANATFASPNARVEVSNIPLR